MTPIANVTVTLDDALQVVEKLDDQSQAKLIELVRSRLEERADIPLAERVAEARRQHAAGLSVEMTVDEIMAEALK